MSYIIFKAALAYRAETNQKAKETLITGGEHKAKHMGLNNCSHHIKRNPKKSNGSIRGQQSVDHPRTIQCEEIHDAPTKHISLLHPKVGTVLTSISPTSQQARLM